jgi:hypothetical protein
MASDKTELRGLVSSHLASALDAIALSRNMDRNAFVNQVLTSEVKRITHEANVLQRMLRGNPLMSESTGSTPHCGDDE